MRLEAWLGTESGGRAVLWLGQQMACDIWQARQKARPEIVRLAGR
jgi:antitoxin HigA-1